MITHSDNTATDVVRDVAGDPRAVTSFLKERGFTGMTVDRSTAEFMRDCYGFESQLAKIAQAVKASISDPVAANAPKPIFEADERGQSAPTAMMTLLAMLARGKLLNPDLSAFILSVMSRTSTGQGRIRGCCPAARPPADQATQPDGRRTSEASVNHLLRASAEIDLIMKVGKIYRNTLQLVHPCT
jgi:beta-lactamase class A